VSVAALVSVKPGHRPRLVYRTHRGRRGGMSRRKGFTEADYAALLDAAHQHHLHQMETWRLIIAFALVATLFGVLAIGLFLGSVGEDIAQFAAPISGLAGIAVGWLSRPSRGQ
jgi:hypothetical protein